MEHLIKPAAFLGLAVHLCDLLAFIPEAPHLPHLYLLGFATALLAVTPCTPRVRLPVAQPAPVYGGKAVPSYSRAATCDQSWQQFATSDAAWHAGLYAASYAALYAAWYAAWYGEVCRKALVCSLV